MAVMRDKLVGGRGTGAEGAAASVQGEDEAEAKGAHGVGAARVWPAAGTVVAAGGGGTWRETAAGMGAERHGSSGVPGCPRLPGGIADGQPGR